MSIESNAQVRDTIIRNVIQTFPNLFTRESINSLIRDSKISLEAANEAIAVIETTDAEKAALTHNTHNGSVIPAASVSDFKLASALEIMKYEERDTYDEFLRVDADRQALVAKVESKYLNDVNLVIGVLKTAPGVDMEEMNEILSTPIVADKAGFGFSTRVNRGL